MSKLFAAEEGNYARTLAREDKLIIPFFQRKYVWNKDNWDELLNAVFKGDTIGFIGSIIVKTPELAVGRRELDVIDGQQRLTTLTLLIVALYDCLSDTMRRNAEIDFKNVLFSNEMYEVDYFPKLEHSKTDAEDYKKIVNLNSMHRQGLTDKEGIIGCYNYFYERLSSGEYSAQQIATKFTDLVRGISDYCVIIKLGENADEQSIFDTLNTTGVPLTSADTIKNNIFNKASQLYKSFYLHDSKDRLVKKYEQTWEKEFVLNDNDVYWDQTVVTGRIKRLNLELFLYCYASIKGMYVSYTDTISDLAQVFKEKLKKINTLDEINSFIDDLINYAKVYRENFDFNDQDVLYEYSKDKVLPRLLHILKCLDSTTMYPFVLNVLYSYKDDTNKVNEILHKLEKYLIINNLTRNTTKLKNYNKLIVTLLSDSEKIDKELQDVENNTEYILLNNISNKMATMYLFWIELYRRYNEKHDITELKYNYSLEHVMPKKWQTNWGQIPDYTNSDGSIMTDEEKREYRNSRIYHLGNMTLLKGKLNSKLQNSSFEVKVPKMKKYADLKITKEDIINPFEEGCIIWDEKKIEERHQKLIENIKSTFLY